LASEGKVAIGDAFFAEDFEFPVFLLLFFFPVAGASDLPTGMSSVICSRTCLSQHTQLSIRETVAWSAIASTSQVR
jgi:hypothetical protein